MTHPKSYQNHEANITVSSRFSYFHQIEMKTYLKKNLVECGKRVEFNKKLITKRKLKKYQVVKNNEKENI